MGGREGWKVGEKVGQREKGRVMVGGGRGREGVSERGSEGGRG